MDYSETMQFRDLIKQMVQQELDKGRPNPTYAKVYSIDLGARTCLVVLTGDTTPVKALLGSIIPATVDQTVRLEGPPGERYVADVLGPNSVDFFGGQQIGWQTPSLGSGFTANSIDPVKYRVVPNNGQSMVQMRGLVNVSGSPTALWTMPTGARPLLNVTGIVIGRDLAGGSVSAQLTANASGTMVLSGGNTGVKSQTNGTGIGGGQAATSASGDQATSNTRTSGPTIVVNNGDTTHQHFGNQHQHVGGAHQHPLDAVTYPTSLSFNGVSYFL